MFSSSKMLKFYFIYALLTSVWIATRASLPHNLPALSEDTATPNPVDCLSTNSLESAIHCRGSRAIRNVIHNLNRNDKPLVLMRGLEIVPIPANVNADAAVGAADSDDSFLGYFSKYLRTHELNIKFSDLLAEESERYLARDAALQSVGANINDGVEARKKDKGQGMLLAMAMMFGKMMAVMGLGGIGALAMKALGVAMAALMMAAIIGLKSLSQHGHESGGHSVQYVTAEGGHHHKRRRRRSVVGVVHGSDNNKAASTLMNDDDAFNPLTLMYRGWQNNYSATKLI